MSCPQCDHTMQKPNPCEYWCPRCGTLAQPDLVTAVKHDPLTVALALAGYHYEVSPMIRATRLYDHFQGDCMELSDLADMLTEHPGSAMLRLPGPTAVVYLKHALDRYGSEAWERARLIEEEVAGRLPWTG
jgi:hypothetical protein